MKKSLHRQIGLPWLHAHDINRMMGETFNTTILIAGCVYVAICMTEWLPHTEFSSCSVTTLRLHA